MNDIFLNNSSLDVELLHHSLISRSSGNSETRQESLFTKPFHNEFEFLS
jgi:hypothetical protein